jgi:valyl-tRNA synthetase
VIHPFQNRRIPIVADEYPDPEFGTGAVKITPAHDFNDFIVGKRQNIEFINIFTDEGKLNEAGAPFTGLQRFDAREAVLAALKEKGLYVGTEDNKMMLPICTRSGNIVEPLMKPQVASFNVSGGLTAALWLLKRLMPCVREK